MFFDRLQHGFVHFLDRDSQRIRTGPIFTATGADVFANAALLAGTRLDDECPAGHCQVAGTHPKLVPMISCPWSDRTATSWGSVDRIFLNLTMPLQAEN